MTHWQHHAPLECPLHHSMLWLGGNFWICPACNRLYVATAPISTDKSVVKND